MAASALAKSIAEKAARKFLVLEQETRFRDRIRGEYVMPVGRGRNRSSWNFRTSLQGVARRRFHGSTWAWAVLRAEIDRPRPAQQQPGMGYSHPEMQETLVDSGGGARGSGSCDAEVYSAGSRAGRAPAFRDRCKPKEFGADFSARLVVGGGTGAVRKHENGRGSN